MLDRRRRRSGVFFIAVFIKPVVDGCAAVPLCQDARPGALRLI